MPRQAPPPLRPSPGRGGGGGDRVWSPWWVTGGADPCAAEVAFGLPPGGLPCSVADGVGPRVVSQSSRPIAAAMVLTACRMAAAVPRTAAVIASVSVLLPAAAVAQPATYPTAPPTS